MWSKFQLMTSWKCFKALCDFKATSQQQQAFCVWSVLCLFHSSRRAPQRCHTRRLPWRYFYFWLALYWSSSELSSCQEPYRLRWVWSVNVFRSDETVRWWVSGLAFVWSHCSWVFVEMCPQYVIWKTISCHVSTRLNVKHVRFYRQYLHGMYNVSGLFPENPFLTKTCQSEPLAFLIVFLWISVLELRTVYISDTEALKFTFWWYVSEMSPGAIKKNRWISYVFNRSWRRIIWPLANLSFILLGV